METKNKNYKRAQNRMKKIKGFYVHLTLYIAVNIFLTIFNLINYNWEAVLSTAIGTGFFWGIAIFFHWYKVFGVNVFFSKDWEQKKIKELMEK